MIHLELIAISTSKDHLILNSLVRSKKVQIIAFRFSHTINLIPALCHQLVRSTHRLIQKTLVIWQIKLIVIFPESTLIQTDTCLQRQSRPMRNLINLFLLRQKGNRIINIGQNMIQYLRTRCTRHHQALLIFII